MGFKTRPRTTGRPGSHDGFTVVELVISVAILLLVLTSLYPLMQVTTVMSVKAKGTTALTNALASEAERLRDLPWSSVTASSITTQTLTVDGFVITIGEVFTDMTAGYGADGTKRIAMTASTGGTGGISALSSTVTIALRNLSSIVIPPGGTSSTGIISFGPLSPPEYSVLHDDMWGYPPYHSPLTIDATYSVPAGEIGTIAFSVDGKEGSGTLLRDSTALGATNASFTYSPPRPSSDTYFSLWHTGQVGVVGSSYAGLMTITNGLHTVTITVTDAMGVQTSASRKYLVDNQSTLPDSIPATALATTLRNNSNMTQDILMDWTHPDNSWKDGDSPVPNFLNRLYQAPPTTAALVAWYKYDLYTPNTSRVATGVAPFSLYTWAVRGESALGWHDSSGVLEGLTQAGYTFTSPSADGTYTGTWASPGNAGKVTSAVTSHVTLTAPTYPFTSSTAKVEVCRGLPSVTGVPSTAFVWSSTWTDVTADAKTAWTTSPYTYTYTDSYTNTATKNDVYPAYKFRITLTPDTGSSIPQQVLTSSIAYVPFMTGPVSSSTALSKMWP